MSEIWKDIEGYDGKYQVSNLGRIRSVDHTTEVFRFGRIVKVHYKGRIRKHFTLKNGYLFVPIRQYPSIQIHRAVAKAFVSGYFEGAQVNHKDENRKNNRWDNLEWVTCKENNNYGSHTRKARETFIKRYSCPIEQYSLNGELIATYASMSLAAEAIGVTPGRIRNIVDTKYTSKGYLFKRNKQTLPTHV